MLLLVRNVTKCLKPFKIYKEDFFLNVILNEKIIHAMSRKKVSKHQLGYLFHLEIFFINFSVSQKASISPAPPPKLEAGHSHHREPPHPDLKPLQTVQNRVWRVYQLCNAASRRHPATHQGSTAGLHLVQRERREVRNCSVLLNKYYLMRKLTCNLAIGRMLTALLPKSSHKDMKTKINFKIVPSPIVKLLDRIQTTVCVFENYNYQQPNQASGCGIIIKKFFQNN